MEDHNGTIQYKQMMIILEDNYILASLIRLHNILKNWLNQINMGFLVYMWALNPFNSFTSYDAHKVSNETYQILSHQQVKYEILFQQA